MSAISRITHRSMGRNVLANLQGNLSRVGKLQQQLSSGKLIAKPSDSPSGTVSVMELRGQIRANAQYSRNAQDGLGWLATVDTALTGSLDILNRVKSLGLLGASTGAQSQNSREAMAAEVDKLRDGLIGLANSTYMERPVFAGAATTTAAYTPAGAYQGDAEQVMRRVGDNATVRVELTGPEAFGPVGNDLFDALGDIANDLRTNPDALQGSMARLDTGTDRLLNAVADVGARTARLERMRQLADDNQITLNSSLAEIESIDLPATIVELQMQQSAYEAALGAASKVIQPSLVDFLR